MINQLFTMIKSQKLDFDDDLFLKGNLVCHALRIVMIRINTIFKYT